MSTLPVDEIVPLLQSLDELIATYAEPMPGPVVVTMIVRRVLGLGEPTRMSDLARAIACVERGEIASALSIAPSADNVLRFADSYIAPRFAPALAQALEERSLQPGPRLAMYLVESDPAAARRLIERIRVTRDPDAFVASVANAYLRVVDSGRTVADWLEQAWQEVIDPRADASSADGERAAARLRLLARRDPLAALDALPDVLDELGARNLGEGTAAVVARAVRVDSVRTWRTLTIDRPCLDRAYVLEALIREQPTAPFDGIAESLIDEWNARGWGVDPSAVGAMAMAMPLLATCATAGRHELASRAHETFGTSTFQLYLATHAESRRNNLRLGTWSPADWESMTQRRGSAGLAARVMGTWPAFSETQIGAWWKLATLPIAELPWPTAFAPDLP